MQLPESVRRHVRVQTSPLVTACCFFFASIAYCVVAERTELFQKVPKRVDPRPFFLCITIITFFTLRTWTVIYKPNPSKPVIDARTIQLLPREQTEEWKGWMQAIVLLYHYFGLSSNLAIYQLVRVLVAAYIFLTGYSHTSYFLKSNDFSIDRTIKTLLRLNLLSCVLACAVNKSWDFYYFPMLTSIWYLVILVTVYCGRMDSDNLSVTRISISLIISCILVQATLYSETGQTLCTEVLFLSGKIGGPQVNAKELIFRLKLDSMMPYWGAFLALIITTRGESIEGWWDGALRAQPSCQRVTLTNTAWITTAILTFYFLAVQQIGDKITSNRWHPLVSIIPIITTLAFRNVTSRQRQRFNRAFQWLGSVSLETYILQSHLWLTKNNKSLLQVNAFDRLNIHTGHSIWALMMVFEKLLLTAVFLIVSHCTAHSTKTIIDWLMLSSKYKITGLLVACWMLNLHWNKLA